MEKHNEDRLARSTSQWMQEVPLESPSSNFTDLIIQNIERQAQPQKALLPKWFWGVFGVSLSILLGGYWMDLWTVPSNTSWELPEINWEMPQLSFSNTMVYAVVIATVMLMGQIYLIKRNYGKAFGQPKGRDFA